MKPATSAADVDYMSGLSVLIVDDNIGLVAVTVNLLKLHGFTAWGVTDSTRAVDAATRHQPDVILLDVMMPDLDGWEVIRQLKATAATRAIPVLFYTACEEPADDAAAAVHGAVGVLKKSQFEVNEFISRLHAAAQPSFKAA